MALEIEWNNKDPFYDRDLNNFRLLFELRVVSVGVIVTRCASLDRLNGGVCGLDVRFEPLPRPRADLHANSLRPANL